MVGARRRTRTVGFERTRPLTILTLTFAGLIVARLFTLQVLQHGFYKALAEGQHSLYEQLFPERGKILLSDLRTGQRYPLATNEPRTLVYADPSKVTDDPEAVARTLSPLLNVDEQVLRERLSKPNDHYEPLAHAVRQVTVDRIRELKLAGIAFADELIRSYPEGTTGSHLAGFLGYVGDQRRGQYGIEGAFEKELAGKAGQLWAERDAVGRWIAVGSRKLEPARDGDDVVLTVDRVIEHQACTALDAAVQRHGADGGSIVVLEPSTGAVLALCGSPDFDPNDYAAAKDASVYLNPVTYRSYEPGSVMKPFTMAAALEEGKVTPNTTYTDTGSVTIGSYTIRNSDGKAHGVQTMTQVLEQSLNTGAIFAMRQVGPRTFAAYLDRFGFGRQTGIELQNESAGDLSALRDGKEIFAATASYGQGITVTPLQLAAAFGAIANRGQLMQPYVVAEVRHPDGTVTTTRPTPVRRVISPSTATTLSAMLVNVVRNGHGQRAGVDGYFVAGKTGTAQIPRPDGPGYEEHVTIGTFGGFAPVEDPKFVMVVRLDRPRDVQFAESSAAPVFGDLAAFILQRLEVPPSTATE